MKFISYHDIQQFRNVVKNVRLTARYIGKDDEGNPVYDNTIPYPIIEFIGTVKLHGTNAGISYDTDTKEIWYQSRKNIITPEKDNAGFAFFANVLKDEFKKIFRVLENSVQGLKNGYYITIFGEWCGKGIQKGVAISELDKKFVIFDIKYSPKDENIVPYYTPIEGLDVKHLNEKGVYNILDFPTFKIKIDFEKPEEIQNDLGNLTEQVEKECPFAKEFGVSGVGEGIVWKSFWKDNRWMFKVKGEKHSVTKVKKLAKIDTEKLKSINEFVDYAVTENRLNQAIEYVFTQNNIDIDITKMGDFLKWIMGDIVKEESDTLFDNGLEPKDVGKYVSNRAREWFFKKLEL